MRAIISVVVAVLVLSAHVTGLAPTKIDSRLGGKIVDSCRDRVIHRDEEVQRILNSVTVKDGRDQEGYFEGRDVSRGLEVVKRLQEEEMFGLYEIFTSTEGLNWEFPSMVNGTDWDFSRDENDNFKGDACGQNWKGITCSCTWMVGARNQMNQGRPYESDEAYAYDDAPADDDGTNQCGVTILALSGVGMKGSFPWSTLTEFPRLEKIHMAHNALTGKLNDMMFTTMVEQHAFGANLTVVDVEFNSGLFGSIPAAFGNLHELQYLAMGSNEIQGTIPESLCNLTKLKALRLDHGHLVGTLPTCLDKLTELRLLDVKHNLLTGGVPDLSPVSHLKILNMDENSLSGTFPKWIEKVPSLEDLSLSSCGLIGRLPQLDGLHNLTYLLMERNFLTGSIPDITDCPKLRMVNLGNNQLQGSIPVSLTEPEDMQFLLLGNNRLTGTFPVENKLENLVALELNNNLLSGNLPISLNAMKKMEFLDVGKNNFTGTIDSSLSELSALQYLILSSNQFTGIVNFVNVMNQRDLELIDISHNRLTGEMPPQEFYNSSALKVVDLSLNCFYGDVHDYMCQARNLTHFLATMIGTAENCGPDNNNVVRVWKPTGGYARMYFDHMEGKIPACMFELPEIEYIHLHGNMIQSDLPSTVKMPENSKLKEILIGSNLVYGTIPDWIGDFMSRGNLLKLDLSNNEIGGTLPESFDLSADSNFTRHGDLKLSVNDLSGLFPPSFVLMKSIDVLAGNIWLCKGKGMLNKPLADPSFEVYSCGSASYTNALTIFMCVIGGVALLLGGAYLFNQPFFEKYVLKIRRWLAWSKRISTDWGAPKKIETSEQLSSMFDENLGGGPCDASIPSPQAASQDDIPSASLESTAGASVNSKDNKKSRKAAISHVDDDDEPTDRDLRLKLERSVFTASTIMTNSNISVIKMGLFQSIIALILYVSLWESGNGSLDHPSWWMLTSLYLEGKLSSTIVLFWWIFCLSLFQQSGISAKRLSDFYREKNEKSKAKSAEKSESSIFKTWPRVVRSFVWIFITFGTITLVEGFMNYFYIEELKYGTPTFQKFLSIFLGVFKSLMTAIIIPGGTSRLNYHFIWGVEDAEAKETLNRVFGGKDKFYFIVNILFHFLLPVSVFMHSSKKCFNGVFSPPLYETSYSFVFCGILKYLPLSLDSTECEVVTTSQTAVEPYGYRFGCGDAILNAYVPVYMSFTVFQMLGTLGYHIFLTILAEEQYGGDESEIRAMERDVNPERIFQYSEQLVTSMQPPLQWSNRQKTQYLKTVERPDGSRLSSRVFSTRIITQVTRMARALTTVSSDGPQGDDEDSGGRESHMSSPRRSKRSATAVRDSAYDTDDDVLHVDEVLHSLSDLPYLLSTMGYKVLIGMLWYGMMAPFVSLITIASLSLQVLGHRIMLGRCVYKTVSQLQVCRAVIDRCNEEMNRAESSLREMDLDDVADKMTEMWKHKYVRNELIWRLKKKKLEDGKMRMNESVRELGMDVNPELLTLGTEKHDNSSKDVIALVIAMKNFSSEQLKEASAHWDAYAQASETKDRWSFSRRRIICTIDSLANSYGDTPQDTFWHYRFGYYLICIAYSMLMFDMVSITKPTPWTMIPVMFPVFLEVVGQGRLWNRKMRIASRNKKIKLEMEARNKRKALAAAQDQDGGGVRSPVHSEKKDKQTPYQSDSVLAREGVMPNASLDANMNSKAPATAAGDIELGSVVGEKPVEFGRRRTTLEIIRDQLGGGADGEVDSDDDYQ